MHTGDLLDDMFAATRIRALDGLFDDIACKAGRAAWILVPPTSAPKTRALRGSSS
jgi:hypothetical protein